MTTDTDRRIYTTTNVNDIFPDDNGNWTVTPYNLMAFSNPMQTTSEHHGDSWSVYGESGYNFRLTDWILQPFAALQYIYLDESGYETTGADALKYTDQWQEGSRVQGVIGEFRMEF